MNTTESRHARSGWYVCPHCGQRLARPWTPGMYVMRPGFVFNPGRRLWRPSGRLKRLATEREAYHPRRAEELPKATIERLQVDVEGVVQLTLRSLERRGATWGDRVLCLCGKSVKLPWHDELAEESVGDG